MMRIALLATAAVALAMTAGACSGSTSPTSGGAATTATTATTARSTTSGAPATSSNGPEVSPTGDIPDNQAFVTYSPPSGGFSVKVPEGWARVETGATTTFTDKLNRVRMETIAASTTPTVQSAQQNELPAIRAATRNFQAGKVSSVTRKAGTAVLITYTADSPPDPVTGKVVHEAVERYEFWKAGNEAILTLSAPTGADNVDPWRIVTDSFTWR
jgi:hypothetical protein